MPWDLLKLEDSNDITIRDIKKAYAKLIKVTRPDRDPEGFQKLRDAYEEALDILRYREYENEYNDEEHENLNSLNLNPENSTNVNIPEPRNQLTKNQPEISLIVDSIILDLKSKNFKSAQTNLERSFEYIYTHPGALEAWDHKLSSTINSEDIHYLDFNDEALCYGIQSDVSNLAQECILAWYSILDFDRLRQFSRHLSSISDTLTTPHTGFFCEQLSCMISVYDSKTATELSKIAAQLMAESFYSGDLESEKRIYLGQIFTPLSDEDRIFWQRATNQEITDDEWNTPEIHEIFKRLNSKANITINNLPLVRELVPTQHTLNVRFKLNSSSSVATMNSSISDNSIAPLQVNYQSEAEYQKQKTSLPWIVWVVLFLLFKALVVSSSDCSGNNQINDVQPLNSESLNPKYTDDYIHISDPSELYEKIPSLSQDIEPNTTEFDDLFNNQSSEENQNPLFPTLDKEN